MADVKFNIKAEDDASKTIAKVDDSLEKLDDTSKNLTETTGKQKMSFEGLMNAFTGLNQGIQLAQQAYQTLQKAYEAIIVKTLDYAEQVRELSRTIGASAEESSKLIQAADDVKVSYESLSTAMNIAIRNGLEPTIEGMGALADQYVAIQSPIERTKFLLDNFGRSGADLAPLMELGADGIRELGEAAEETGLVLDQDALDKTRTYEIAVDNLGDTLDGMATTIGVAVIPSLIDLVDYLTDVAEALNAIDPQAIQYLMDIMIGAIPGLNIGLNKNVKALGEQADMIFNNTKTFEEYARVTNNAGLSLEYKTEQEWYAAKVVAYNIALGDSYNATIVNTVKELKALGGAQSFVTEEGKKLAEELTAAYSKQRDVIEKDLAKAYDSLGKAVGGFRQNVASGLVAGLEDAGLSGDELLERLKILDQYAGTQYAVDYQMELQMPELLEKLINDPESFLEEAQKFEDYFLPLQNSVKAAQGEIDTLQSTLNALERDYYANIRLIFTTSGSMTAGTYGPSQQTDAAGGIVHAASGIPITAPYLVGELGPEPFFPAVDGRIISHGEAIGALRSGSRGVGAVNVSINTPMNFADKIWVERELVPYIKDAIDQIDRGA